MPLTGPIPEGRTFFCPHCGALYSVTYSRLSTFAWAGLTRTPIGSIRPPMSISDGAGAFLGAQPVVGAFLATFNEYPPSQRPSSFSIDAICGDEESVVIGVTR
jgi:hypothetical protein